MRLNHVLLSGLLVTGLALGGCAAAEPKPPTAEPMTRQLRILVDPKSTKAVVLGEIYMQTLRKEGRDAALVGGEASTPAARMRAIASGEADMIIACTGRALAVLDAGKARELEAKYKAEDAANNSGGVMDRLEETHDALMGALPALFTTVDPSSAHGCTELPDQDLPQNIVPIYLKGSMNRQQRFEVNSVTKYLTDDDLDALVEEVDRKGDAHRVVEHWIETSTASSGDTGNNDSDATDGKEDAKDSQTEEGKK